MRMPRLCSSAVISDVSTRLSADTLAHLLQYLSCLGESKGSVPEFINPKYSDETRTAFSTPTVWCRALLSAFPVYILDSLRSSFNDHQANVR